MGGTFDEVPNGEIPVKYAARSRNDLDDSAGTCTLLGPEGPDEQSATQDLFLRRQRRWRRGYRPYFENYTVDASILETMRKHRFTNE